MKLRSPFIPVGNHHWVVYELVAREDLISVNLNCYVMGSIKEESEGETIATFIFWDEKERDAFFEVMEEIFGLLREVRR